MKTTKLELKGVGNLRKITEEEMSLVIKWFEENYGITKDEVMDSESERFFVLENYMEDGPGYTGIIIFGVGGYVNAQIQWTLVIPERDGEAYLEKIKSEM